MGQVGYELQYYDRPAESGGVMKGSISLSDVQISVSPATPKNNNSLLWAGKSKFEFQIHLQVHCYKKIIC